MSAAGEAGLVATPSQTVGPFFHAGLTADAAGRVVRPLAERERILLLVVVTDGDGHAVSDAVVEVWQEVGDGDYRSAFGRLPTNAAGSCEFETVRPPRHINVCLFARGLQRQVHTRMYFADDPTLDADPVLNLVPHDRRRTLVGTRDETQPTRWRFNVKLQGPGETVFFDA